MVRVSVIIPCFNEESTIRLLLDALWNQTFPTNAMEVVIADGMSTDLTREQVAKFQNEHPELPVKLVDNPKHSIPSGLNQAIKAAEGSIIVRLDAHSVPNDDYVARCVAALDDGCGDNVGGVWKIRPGKPSWQARAIAVAASHPLGVGDAFYRYADHPQAVDTVPFGAFHRSLIDKIGLFDESLLTNEDYEFNTRIRQEGGIIWLDPTIQSIYFSRSSIKELARQYWRYGYWKVRMLRRYPQTLRWRQALPPLFVLSLLTELALSPWFALFRWIFVIELAIYISILLLAGLRVGVKSRDIGLIFGVPLAIMTMHITWGSAFLWSLISK